MVSRLFFASYLTPNSISYEIEAVPLYILYLDESGNPENPADKHFVLAGIAVFETQAYFVSNNVDEIQSKHFPGVPPIEFHASHIRSGKDFWRNITASKRDEVLHDLCAVIAKSHSPGLILFGAVIEKNNIRYGDDAIRLATEQVCKRFDTFLVRQFHEKNEPQRGMLVFAESHYQARAKVWVRDFRKLGTQWGVLRNLCDIPYFASTRETRLLQLADLVAHSIFISYEKREDSLSNIILKKFDNKDGVLHGLVHVSDNKVTCVCPACLSRKNK